MKEKSRFQRELERHASKQIIVTILTGCFFFCIAMAATSMLEQKIRQERHLDAITATFLEIWDSSKGFLMSEENSELLLACVQSSTEENRNSLKYQMGKYNLEAQVDIHLLVMDQNGAVMYESFPEDEMNLHRLEFNRAAAQNAKVWEKELYSTVYFLDGDTSEYVLIRPLYEKDEFVGSAAVYLEASDWNLHFQKYQYDAILTNTRSDVIYCSNHRFLEGYALNKYQDNGGGHFRSFGDSRYLTDSRFLESQGVYLYSFIYTPGTHTLLMIGVAVIVGLGLVWAGMFFHLMHAMAAKTSRSVGQLIGEIRTIRKEDPHHRVKIDTGDELEEIAEQINKMMASINELNQKNLDLVNVNNRMEIQNLQAQINPHFIYNTLDNIRYLIVQDAAKADELIERFTHILRYSINNTKSRTCLQEDMEYIEDYLIIQKTRFGKKFSYSVEIEEDCWPVIIPKLLLQPLIENSLKYGFRKKASISVWIRGYTEGQYLILEVKDNGPGQPQSILETLRSILNSGKINIAHNGLQNINRRIFLEYGHDSGLLLDSREGEEFTVTMRLWIGEGNHV